MSPEELQKAIDFMVQSQAEFWAQQQIIQENYKKFDARQEKFEARQEKTQVEIETLLQVSRNLVEVARIHSNRLDRLEDPGG